MTTPDTLPVRLYLLGYDPRRETIHGGAYHSTVIRAAAIEDLRLRGPIVDDGGQVHLGSGPRPGDSILLAVLTEISASTKPRTWRHWISASTRTTFRAVRDQLDDLRVVRVEPYRVLGIFPANRVRPRDIAAIQHVSAEFEHALTGSGQPAPREAAMVTLAAAGELGTVLPWRRRREMRARIAALSEGPVPRALRQVVRAAKSAASG
jgi:hypothetical protein